MFETSDKYSPTVNQMCRLLVRRLTHGYILIGLTRFVVSKARFTKHLIH